MRRTWVFQRMEGTQLPILTKDGSLYCKSENGVPIGVFGVIVDTCSRSDADAASGNHREHDLTDRLQLFTKRLVEVSLGSAGETITKTPPPHFQRKSNKNRIQQYRSKILKCALLDLL